jgi:hypothetical protein
MKPLKSFIPLLLALAVIAVSPAHARPRDFPGRLPARTVAYVYWRGADSVVPGSRNPVVALWNDPGFAPARQLIERRLIDFVTSNPDLARVPPQEIEALLARPLIFGLRLTEQAASPQSKSGATANARGFLVVQVGAQAAEARAALSAVGPKAAAHMRLTPAGFLVASGDPATLADLVRRFGGARALASRSLGGVPVYQEARAELVGRPPIEFFLRIPAIAALQPQKTAGFNTPAFLHALNVDRVHLLCGAVNLNAPSGLLSFSILGNTSPGSLFDLFGPNGRAFPTLAAAPARSISFSTYRLDVGSVMSVVVNALSAAMDPNTAARVKMFAGLISSAVVPSLAGEYASIRTGPAGRRDAGTALYAITIHPKAANQLFATTLAPFVQPAGEEGVIHYFRVVQRGPSGAPNAGKGFDQAGGKGAARRHHARPLFIALTPHLLLAGRNEALVRRRAQAVISSSPQPGLAAQPSFRAARAELPGELSGLSYFDFARIRWTNWLEHAAARMAKNKKDPHAAEHAAALRKWAQEGGGAVLARHLHWLAVGSWKDSSGVHWRGNIH